MEYKNFKDIKTLENLQEFINTCSTDIFKHLVSECTWYSEHGNFEEDDTCFKLCEKFVKFVPNVAFTVWQMVALRCMKEWDE